MFGRNLVLAGVAGLIIIQGSPGLSLAEVLGELKVGEAITLFSSLLGVGLLITVTVYLRRVLDQQAVLFEQVEAMKRVIDEDYAEPVVEHEQAAAPVEGLPIGAPAPEFSLASSDGKRVTLDNLLTYGKPVLLLFVSPHCPPCEAVFAKIRNWQSDYKRKLTIALLSKGSERENQALAAKHGAKNVLTHEGASVSNEYGAKWTPAAIVIGSNGRIASDTVYGEEAIVALVARVGDSPDAVAVAGNGHRTKGAGELTTLKIGDLAPSFSIPDLEGGDLTLNDLAGQDTLLLFWDPGCPYCRAMSDDLMRWEAKPPKTAPQLLFIASGDLEQVKAASRMFKSRFFYERDSELSMLFGTTLTPSAVLIDGDLRLASDVELGLPNVRALAGMRSAGLPVAPSLGRVS